MRLNKLFAPCVQCGSLDAQRNYTAPQISLHASGVAEMARIHKCDSCGSVFAGPDEPATLTDILHWVISTKTLTIKQSGITVLIQQAGGPVAEIQIEPNDFGDGIRFTKTVKDGEESGEIEIDYKSASPWELIGRVINAIQNGGNGNERTSES